MGITYKDAGVDIDAGDALVDRIAPLAAATHRKGVLAGVGGFGALFALRDAGRWQDPVLVSGTDGVGTKLLLAAEHDRLDGVGYDLVAMCVNDILCHGAEPLFFLDYYASGKLQLAQAEAVVRSIAAACSEAGCALVGGETAELPGLYQPGHIDLAGFAVGVVERSEVITGEHVAPGDVVLGLPSSGPHSNGYALLRRVFTDPTERVDGVPVLDLLLAPTRIYARAVRAALATRGVRAIAHITGGGIAANLERVLPAGVRAPLVLARERIPAVLQAAARSVEPGEMLQTFNLGVGLILVAGRDHAAAVNRALEPHGVFHLGEIVARGGAPAVTVQLTA